MSTLHSSRFVVALLAVASASFAFTPAAHADDRPRARIVKKEGRDPELNFEWDLAWVQLSNVANRSAQTRVNRSLAADVASARRSMRRDLESYEETPGHETSSSLSISMTVGLLTERLLSVNVIGSMYYQGAAHPNSMAYSLTYDLRTGAKVPVRGLFRPGADVMARVAALADANLRAQTDYGTGDDYILSTPTADDITAVVVERDGLRILFGDQQLGPHGAGLPEAKLTFAELQGLVATDGAIRAVVTAAPTVGLAGALPAR